MGPKINLGNPGKICKVRQREFNSATVIILKWAKSVQLALIQPKEKEKKVSLTKAFKPKILGKQGRAKDFSSTESSKNITALKRLKKSLMR